MVPASNILELVRRSADEGGKVEVSSNG